MAEGFGHQLKSESYNFYSAGTKKHGLNPRAVQVMQEVDVDITAHKSNTVDELETKMDFVFTVCGDAFENCPYFPGGEIIHVGFDDPPRLTAAIINEEEILTIYRRVRDEIKIFVNEIEKHL
jgi:arsenate reductase